MKILLILRLASCLLIAISPRWSFCAVDHQFQELSHPLRDDQKREGYAPPCSSSYGAVSVDGIAGDSFGWPHRCNEQYVDPDLLKESPLIGAWSQAFADCRSRENHEGIKTAATLVIPTVAAGFTGYFLHKMSQTYAWGVSQSASAVAGGAAWLYLQFVNRSWYRRLSNYLDDRADRAALASCGDRKQVAQLIEQLKRMRDRLSVRCCSDQSYSVRAGGSYGSNRPNHSNRPGSSDFSPAGEHPYEFFALHAYNSAQANVCSCIKISINFPLPWLSATPPSEALERRIAALEAFQQDARV